MSEPDKSPYTKTVKSGEDLLKGWMDEVPKTSDVLGDVAGWEQQVKLGVSNVKWKLGPGIQETLPGVHPSQLVQAGFFDNAIRNAGDVLTKARVAAMAVWTHASIGFEEVARGVEAVALKASGYGERIEKLEQRVAELENRDADGGQ